MSELSKLEKRIADVRAEQVKHERLCDQYDANFHKAVTEDSPEDMPHFKAKKRQTLEYLEMLAGQLSALEDMKYTARLADTLPIIKAKQKEYDELCRTSALANAKLEEGVAIVKQYLDDAIYSASKAQMLVSIAQTIAHDARVSLSITTAPFAAPSNETCHFLRAAAQKIGVAQTTIGQQKSGHAAQAQQYQAQRDKENAA